MQGGIRTKRLGGTIRKHLSAIMAREVLDPRLAALAIENVEMTGDLGIANVQVRLMYGDDSSVARDEALAAVRRVAPGLRAALAPVLGMRRVPELRFHYDVGIEQRRRIDEVLQEISDERKTRPLVDESASDSGEGAGSAGASPERKDGGD
ncbi:MAG TPA: 30S ribosome-binding factor RbfA [Polyangiaceae bacterium]|nr:30S ribosome-binding factor RbfA [Polyangiaceae bacterium]